MTECLKALVLALYPFEANQEVQSHYDKTRHYQSSHERCLLPYNKDLNFQSHSSEYPSEIYKLHCISSAYLEDYVLTTDEGKTLLQSGLQKLPCRVDRSPESRNHLVAAISALVTAVHDLLIGDWTDFFLSECIPNTSDECPESETSSDSHQQHTDATKNAFLVREVLQRLGQCLGKIPSIPEGGDAMSTQLMQLTAYVSDQLDQMEAVDDGMLLAEKPSVTIVTNEQSRNIWLQKAIGRVDARLDGYEDYLGQLLSSSDLWEEESLIECLERNTVVLALPRFVKQLIDVAMEMDEQEIDEALLQRVLKVLLASFTSLPFLLQNHLRDYLWSHPTGASIFTRHNIQNLDHELTSIFNRLVTLAQGHENTEVFRALSCLALQSPSQTLQLTIHRAVSNTAVCQAICQVLRAMPSLATFKLQGNKWSLVCHFIKEAAGNLATSTNEEANLIQLVTTLLQPYKPFLDPRSPFWMPSVLSTQGVTQVCVLPYLKTCTRNSSQMHLMTALKFLKGILDNSQQTLNIDGSIFGSSPFPIMLCLFELLDNCYLLWDDITTATQKVEVKEVVLGLLGRMAGMVKEMHHGDNTGTEHGIAWLFSRVSATLHWTTALHVNELLTDLLPHPMKIVPECLFDICNLSEDSAWFPIPSNNNQRITSVCDQLTELLQCCRVSDNLSAILIQGIQKNKMTSCCQEALTLALVQVLPHCIMGEWQCIMGMLKQLLANGILRVPCSAHYVRELPMVDITDFKVHLSLSQLLLSVMQLLNNPCCEDWATPQLLHHVTRCHVNTMQNLASDILNSDLQNELGSLFVIGQLFCHTCEVISILPTDDLKEQVFVLTLQYLSQLEEVTQTSVANKELDLEWTNQRAMFELVTNQKLAGEQRRTLLQKITSN